MAWHVAERKGPARDHLRVQPGAWADQPQEVAAVPVGPVQHRSDAKAIARTTHVLAQAPDDRIFAPTRIRPPSRLRLHAALQDRCEYLLVRRLTTLGESVYSRGLFSGGAVQQFGLGTFFKYMFSKFSFESGRSAGSGRVVAAAR